jgi:hypothetical protein
VGLAAALAGVFIRTGSVISFGERVVSGLVQRLGLLSFVSDNAGCFGNKPFPRNGCFITFGAHEVYVGTKVVRRYPERVLVAADPPSIYVARGRCSDHPASCIEVMMTAPAAPAAGARKAVAADADAPPAPQKSHRTGRPPI